MTTNTSSQVKKITEVWASWLSSLALCYAKRLLRGYDTLLVCRIQLWEDIRSSGGARWASDSCGFLLPPHSGNEFRLRFRIDHIQLYRGWRVSLTGSPLHRNHLIQYLLLFPCHDSLTLLEWSPLKPAALVGLIVIHHRDPMIDSRAQSPEDIASLGGPAWTFWIPWFIRTLGTTCWSWFPDP